MPIPLPNLDDRSFAELTAQARSLLPGVYPKWTNHNPSDPGIVLIELLAWLTEMLLYQVDQIPAANTEKFLKLLNDPGWVRPEATSLEEAVRQTVVRLRQRYRAVTPDDYERLALDAWPRSDAADTEVDRRLRRVRCVARRDLTADPAVRRAPAPAHVSLVIMPEPAPDTPADQPQPSLQQCAALWTYLEERRTLTTRHHVVGPAYVPVEVAADLALYEDAVPDQALDAARQALTEYFHPIGGGPDRTGWPFGRAVYASEVYALMDQLSAVDYVDDVRLSTADGTDRLETDPDGNVVSIWLDAHELVLLRPTGLRAYDVYGQRYG